jgi:hypothetical protein
MIKSFETRSSAANGNALDYQGLETYATVHEDSVVNTLEVTVEVTDLPGAKAYAEALFSSLSARSMRELPEELSVDRLYEAFNALLYLRVLQLDHKTVQDHPALHYSRVRYPALLFPVFRAVGHVQDFENGLDVRVVAKGDLLKWSKAKDDVWNRVESTLRRLTDFGTGLGLEMATALPKDTDGKLSILALLAANGRIVSTKRAETQADLMIRSLLGLTMTENVLGIPHVEYNTVKFYQTQYAGLVNACYRE